jgi:hypothetical protein
VVASTRVVNDPFDDFGRPDDFQTEPLDVEQGDPAVVRNFTVAFGTLRAFRAQASVSTPRIDTDLALVGDTLRGTVTNATDVALQEVSLVYGNGLLSIGQLAPHESRAVELTNAGIQFDSMAERLVPASQATDPDSLRRESARRSIIRHLEGGWQQIGGSQRAFGNGPVILAWSSGGLLDVDIGAGAETLGETLYVLASRARIEGPATFVGNLVDHTTLELNGLDASQQGVSYFLNRGTITAEYRPVGFEGTFTVSELLIRLATDTTSGAGATGQPLAPLPEAEQPATDDPLLSNPRPGQGRPDTPRIQLYDMTAQRWIEFEPAEKSKTYSVPEPARYVDDSGAFRVRFVARDVTEYAQFTMSPRITGTVE